MLKRIKTENCVSIQDCKNCRTVQNNNWICANLNNLSVELFQENSNELNNYYSNQKNKINNILKNKLLIEYILSNINYSYLSSKPKLYDPIKNEIKAIIRTSKYT